VNNRINRIELSNIDNPNQIIKSALNISSDLIDCYDAKNTNKIVNIWLYCNDSNRLNVVTNYSIVLFNVCTDYSKIEFDVITMFDFKTQLNNTDQIDQVNYSSSTDSITGIAVGLWIIKFAKIKTPYFILSIKKPDNNCTLCTMSLLKLYEFDESMDSDISQNIASVTLVDGLCYIDAIILETNILIGSKIIDLTRLDNISKMFGMNKINNIFTDIPIDIIRYETGSIDLVLADHSTPKLVNVIRYDSTNILTLDSSTNVSSEIKPTVQNKQTMEIIIFGVTSVIAVLIGLYVLYYKLFSAVDSNIYDTIYAVKTVTLNEQSNFDILQQNEEYLFRYDDIKEYLNY
jgi:hypothetical protein